MPDPLTPAQAVQVARRHLAQPGGPIGRDIAAGLLTEIDQLREDNRRLTAALGRIAANGVAAAEEAARLTAVIDKVRALHVRYGVPSRDGVCACCHYLWPCETAKLLPDPGQPTQEGPEHG